MTEEERRDYYKYMASLSPEDREALLDCMLPSRTPFFRPLDQEPDFSEWTAWTKQRRGEHA